ncbi:Carboxypeptidase regulatory-like domain-containing protein [Bryocella elongata]|uniref:Carboxypeptidase regulatory-like domain-containing protein n=1 Tax=Bryocella elongata TaxID=863522 RepID=A0A1H5S923_9BACT|nr:carboxypeptidase regulatory-like domain-containing protein [Bryocella elongata]SEF46341.1 Carboxypeptidase regulatory-like domain-containing protein [Bryocella elongata]
MITLRTASTLSLTAALLALGCKNTPSPSGAASPAAGSTSQAPVFTPSAAPPSSMGSVSGVVNFTGAVPQRVHIDMTMDPGCAFGADNMSEPYVIDKGHVANVYVYVKSGAQETSASPGTVPVLLDQKDCKYTPHVIAIQQGASVSFHNSDSTMHNIHVVPTNPGNKTVDFSEAPQSPAQTATFNTEETMIAVRCNNHPWMNAFINVAPNPYFAVTGPDGSFTIHGLPPGHYTLAAVHEKMGEQDIDFSISGGTTTHTNFTFTAPGK